MLPATFKILIADDDEGDRKLICRTLQQTGLQHLSVETSSIDEAVQAGAKMAFDCVIVDYRLPGENGLDGLSTLRHRYPYAALIMMTGQGDEMVAAEAIKRGAADYIPKTLIKPQALRRSISNAVEKANLQKRIAQQQTDLSLFNRVLVHDLKAPLHAIQSFATLIEESLEEQAYQPLAEYSRRISRAAGRTGELIEMLHRYTKAEENIPFEPVEMNSILDDTLANLDSAIHARNGHVTRSDLPAVCGSAPQLMQLLQNLIGNGLKYCAPQVVPAVHVEAVARDGQGGLFSVRDNGIGIPKEQLEQIFQPFHRLHGSAEYEGTGLGLATCKKIVERHGGRIWCESEVGKGSTFLFTLPGMAGELTEGRAHAATPR